MQIEKGTDKLVKTIRLMIKDSPGYLGRVATAIGDMGGNIGNVKINRFGMEYNTRDFTVFVDDEAHLERVLEAIGKVEGVIISDVIDLVLELHRGGKIRMKSTVTIDGVSEIRKIYTPGVAKVCKMIQGDPDSAYDYTSIGNSVAIATNGSAILGLGNIGAVAGMPVMEGKAVLFDYLVGINGIPVLIKSDDPEEIIAVLAKTACTYGAIKLEDIKAPDCFRIEDRLTELLDIPVMHDDQHGTAVVVLAALFNASKYVGMMIKNDIVGVVGLGAAGMGISKLLLAYGVRKLLGTDLSEQAMEILKDKGGEPTGLEEIMRESDIVICTTGVGGLIKKEMIRKGQVILALSNPFPEIMPEDAKAAGASFAADGKGVNNALAFPGIFRGALNARARKINNRMKLAAAKTIAKFAEPGELVPGILNIEMHSEVSKAVERAAFESGIAKPKPDIISED
ncbi:MAG: ACT domain-containing protein [Deltaproteobacteria bacterium]|nr:ACT domain-containing protein [Deltaproteobacteria bacterium]NIS77995.1 ACT domain-containing protein [Deltaproteobacteria bacterium]